MFAELAGKQRQNSKKPLEIRTSAAKINGRTSPHCPQWDANACEYLINGQWWSPGVASDSNIRFVELAPFASGQIYMTRSRESEVPWRMEILIEEPSHGYGIFSDIVYPDGKGSQVKSQ